MTRTNPIFLFSSAPILSTKASNGGGCLEERACTDWNGFGKEPGDDEDPMSRACEGEEKCYELCYFNRRYPNGEEKSQSRFNSRIPAPEGISTEAEDNSSIPESFYTNGGLKLRVVWTISSLIAVSTRHYLVRPIIKDHPTLCSLVLTDADVDQGTLTMGKEQLCEFREKPFGSIGIFK
ncbi:hypothetical protein ZOSMA_1G00360 [Zostera marina]|uniref:Uncharacterized protein n=1 Tax=Zostera marina TaxID=29655 RepID=A0A0K9PPA4_ZOSMR|nr:hypothetical protein ZOSMA_1G00360 [Zostera marina]